MVKQFQEIARKICDIYIDTSVVAFLKMDDNVDTWSMLYSSSTISDNPEYKENRRLVFKQLANIVTEVLGEDRKEIARIGVFGEEDHLVADLLKYKAGTHIDEDTKMNGNIVHEAYILVSGHI